MRLLLTALLAAAAALLPEEAAAHPPYAGDGYAQPRHPPPPGGYGPGYHRPPPRDPYPPGRYDPRPPPDYRQACRQERAAFAVGRRYSAALAEQARRAARARVVRAIRPGMAYTREFRADRLNLELDRRGRVRAVRCG